MLFMVIDGTKSIVLEYNWQTTPKIEKFTEGRAVTSAAEIIEWTEVEEAAEVTEIKKYRR